MKQNNSTYPYRVQALDRALDILACFSFQKRELSLTEVVQCTGLHKATAKRMLSNLCQRDYLQQDHQSKRYTLGLKLLELGGIVYSSLSLRRAASQHMDNLRAETGLMVLLGAERNEELVFLDERQASGAVRLSSCIGLRRHLHFGMLGMVLLAFRSRDFVDSILAKYPLEAYTPNSLTDSDAFRLRLAQVHEQGYVVEIGEGLPGFCGIAAPVRDYSRRAVAALGVVVPLSPDNPLAGEARLVKLVRRAAGAVSTDLGYLVI